MSVATVSVPGLAPVDRAADELCRRLAGPVPAQEPSWRALRTHRRCAPEHAGQVRRLCAADRSVLPRWHQDDRGPVDTHRGVHVSAPDGAYSRIEAWRSRQHWITWVVPTAIGLHRDILAKHHVDPDTFRAWALVKSGYAHTSTGRRCVVRPDTLASVMGVCERTVQRCTAAARELGLEIVVLAGRMLTFPEVAYARRNGSRQRGLSTEVALTNPQVTRRLVEHVTPTRGKIVPHQNSPLPVLPHGLAAEQKEAAPPRTDHKGCPRTQSRPAGWSLAQELARNVPWLAAEPPARLAPALSRFATCKLPWQSADVATAIEDHTSRRGTGPIRPHTIRTRPAALLAAILRHLDPDTDHPALIQNPFTNPTPTTPEPCHADNCDHGWITHTRPNGRPALTPCPTSPPTIRTWHPTNTDDTTWDPTNPPF